MKPTKKSYRTPTGNLCSPLGKTHPSNPPEQGSGEVVSTTSDQYSLGILLYKLLTDLHPFDVDDLSFRQLEKMMLQNTPPFPTLRLAACKEKVLNGISNDRNISSAILVKRLKGDLDVITGKVLRKNPEERYA